MAHVSIHNPATNGDWDCPEGVLSTYLDAGWVLATDKAPERYTAQTVAELKDEIGTRNSGRDEANQIPATGNKSDLIAALVADDSKEQ